MILSVLFSRVTYCFLDNPIPTPMSVINKPIEEDRFDIPDVPMED